MTIAVLRRPDRTITSTAATDFSLYVYQIIEMAYTMAGKPGITYTDMAKNILQVLVLNLQAKGYYFWVTEDVKKSFSAPSEVSGDGDSKNYTCYLSHASLASNRPPTGQYYTNYWYEGGENGVAWTLSTAYTATGDFSPDVDTLGIDTAKIRYYNSDYPVEIVSKYQYDTLPKKQNTGRPKKLYFDDSPSSPKIYLYPQVARDDASNFLLTYKRFKKLSNLDGVSEMDEYKSAWLLPLAKLLAKELSALDLTFPLDRLLLMGSEANKAIENARRSRSIKTIQRRG